MTEGCQSRALSALEAGSNVVVGFVLAVLMQLALFPVMGLAVTLPQSLGLGSVFTVASLARSYLLRRLFTRWGG